MRTDEHASNCKYMDKENYGIECINYAKCDPFFVKGRNACVP